MIILLQLFRFVSHVLVFIVLQAREISVFSPPLVLSGASIVQMKNSVLFKDMF